MDHSLLIISKNFLHRDQYGHNLRWYGTPCNIFKDDRILKNDYNHGFKIFKINICPQYAYKYYKIPQVR